MPSPGMDTSENEKHGIKPDTWGLENPIFFFKWYICFFFCSNPMFVFRLQAIYLTHGQGEKIILQTFLRTGSNSCVWGGQSLAKIGKNESFSTGHPNNSGGRSAASICNKALVVSCKSFCMERLRSFSAWGWSWLDMKEPSPWDGTYFRWFVRSDLYLWCQQMVKRKEMSNQMTFPKQIICPRYILSCLGHPCTFLFKGNVLQGSSGHNS